MVAARRRSASSGPLRGVQRHVRRRARSCVQSNLPAMPTIGEGGLIPPISGQSLYQIPKRLTLLPISQSREDLIQRCRGEFDMAAPISLREDFDRPMLRALVLSEKAG